MSIRHASAQELWVCDLGTVRYADALAIQEHVRARRQRDELPDALLLLEHPPVYTLGRRAQPSELALGEDFYRARGIDIHTCDRGGRITYHGPGQLVAYPIVAVQDVLEYVRALERAIVAALGHEGLHARSRSPEGPDYTGVWLGERKIASIGVHVQRGVTTHGLAVNVANDLAPFGWIVACGLPDVVMTSLQHELGARAPDTRALIARFRAHLLERLAAELSLLPRAVSATRLGLEQTHASGRASGRAPLSSPTAVAV